MNYKMIQYVCLISTVHFYGHFTFFLLSVLLGVVFTVLLLSRVVRLGLQVLLALLVALLLLLGLFPGRRPLVCLDTNTRRTVRCANGNYGFSSTDTFPSWTCTGDPPPRQKRSNQSSGTTQITNQYMQLCT